MPRRISRLLIYLLPVLVLVPTAVFADVGKIAFTTGPQTIAPGAVSAVFTIQTQDASGNSAKVTETTDVNLVSTSPTGEFSSSNTSWQPTQKLTMSTNTSNKNFYYKDSSVGVFTITVTATGRTSGSSWNTSQPVTISNESSDASSTAGSSGDSAPTSNQSSAISAVTNVISEISTHYSYLPLSAFNAAQSLAVDAGRSRLSAAGAPVAFHATADRLDTGVEYDWTFGDGSTAVGRDVIHRYEFPGEYAVVLNASSPLAAAVARTSVTVTAPALSIVEADDLYVALHNAAAYEVNLYGWRLSAGGIHFDFPRDTIIGAGTTVYFPSKTTHLAPASAPLVTLALIDAPQASVPQDVVLADKKSELANIQARLAELSEEVSRLPVETVPIAEALTPVSNAPETVAASLAVASSSVSNASSSWLSTFKNFLLGR